MPEYKALPALLILLAAIAVYAVLQHGCGKWGRRYGVVGMGGVLLMGVDLYYDLPLYVYVIGICLAPLLFHATVKSRLEKAARKLSKVELPELGIVLEWVRDPNARHVALWRAVPLAGREPAGLEQKPAGRGDPRTLVLALDFIGETDDDYGVVLWGETARDVPAEMVIHHGDGDGRFTRILADKKVMKNIPGQDEEWVVREHPQGFAHRVLGMKAFTHLREIFNLRNEKREIYVHVEGRVVRVGASRTFDLKDLQRFLIAGALWIQMIRSAESLLPRPDKS